MMDRDTFWETLRADLAARVEAIGPAALAAMANQFHADVEARKARGERSEMEKDIAWRQRMAVERGARDPRKGGGGG